MDQDVPQAAAAPQVEDGTSAVLYAMFRSFTEVLGRLESRLDGIEASVRVASSGNAGVASLGGRLAAIEEAVRAMPSAGPAIEARLAGIEEAVSTMPTTGAVLDARLAAIEEVVRAAPDTDRVDARLAGIAEALRVGRAADAGSIEAGAVAAEMLGSVEDAVRELSQLLRARADEPAPVDGPAAATSADGMPAISAALSAQGDLLDQRTLALAAAVEALRELVQAHVDETAHSLGRRAGEAGRRLATDLGLRSRAKPPRSY